MGDEADADWQDGLVEWGEEDARLWYQEQLSKAARTSPFRSREKPRRRRYNRVITPFKQEGA